jgi:uridine kinase
MRMARWTPQKTDVISALAAEILHNYGKGRAIVAVDGLDGAGKTRFADALAEELGRGSRSVFRASVDDFHRPRAERYARGKDSPEGFYKDSYNYSTLKRVLIEPFRIGRIGSFVLAAFDLERDAPFEQKWTSAGDDAILVIDGIFLNRPELRGLWNYSIWLDADAATREERLLARDGEGSFGPRWNDAQALYLDDGDPRSYATATIDNSDFEHPRRVFSDSC